ncbi:MAG: hypothetical protein GXW85_06110 [Clostridia bacterium]|nr:hypothetical protein [Clostridia bacterium]
MKKNLCLLIFMALSLILTSGYAEITDWEPTKYDYVNDFNSVNMTVKEETVSSTGLTVVIENNSDIEFIYGEYFQLEKKIKGNWYQVPVIIENYGFDDIGYTLAPGGIGKWNVEWDWLYGSLDAGEYRIVKIIADLRTRDNNRYKSADSNQYILAAEFKILSD